MEKLRFEYLIAAAIALIVVSAAISQLGHNEPFPDWLRTALVAVLTYFLGAATIKPKNGGE